MAEEHQSEAEPPPLKIDETERIIARLEQVVRDRRVVLVGGQAVAIWASKLADRIADTLVETVASRDIDLLGNSSDLRQSAELLGGRVRVANWEDRTPLTGVAIFLDGAGHERRLDVLASVYGMDSDDLRRGVERCRPEPGARAERSHRNRRSMSMQLLSVHSL